MSKGIDPELADEIQDVPRAVVDSTNPNDRALGFRSLMRGNVMRFPSGQQAARQLATEYGACMCTRACGEATGSTCSSPPARGKPAQPNRLVKTPTPAMLTSTLSPSCIGQAPTEVPQAIRSPGSRVMSPEMRLTISWGEKIMSDTG